MDTTEALTQEAVNALSQSTVSIEARLDTLRDIMTRLDALRSEENLAQLSAAVKATASQHVWSPTPYDWDDEHMARQRESRARIYKATFH